MKIKALTKQEWQEFLSHLIAATRVVGVQEKEKGFFTFADLTDPGKLRLDYDVTYLSPRKFFQPPRETLLTFTTRPKVSAEPVVEADPFVLVGVHPYDLKAINQMDAVFSKDHKDPNYIRRREAATIIASDPQAASAFAFWPWMNAATVNTGFDLYVTDLGTSLVIEIGSDTGEQLLTKHASARDATEEEVAARASLRGRLKDLCRTERALKVPAADVPRLVASAVDNPLWEERAQKCFSCGTCNQVCPTCYCFDVREHLNLDCAGGSRVRHWDGCLLEDFALIGSGENFREHRAARFRHRVLRKTNYVPHIIDGDLACVGCGRCSSGCLPDIADPVSIINDLA